MCKRMVEKIQRKDGEGAIAMLEREPSMAWMRDVDTGAYPLHIAVWQVNLLLLLPSPKSISCLSSVHQGCILYCIVWLSFPRSEKMRGFDKPLIFTSRCFHFALDLFLEPLWSTKVNA